MIPMWKCSMRSTRSMTQHSWTVLRMCCWWEQRGISGLSNRLICNFTSALTEHWILRYNRYSKLNTKYPADANNAESRTRVLDLLAELEKAEERNYKNYCIQQNDLEIINIIVANEELNKIKLINGFDPIYRSHATSAISNFKSKFNREPKQNAEDLKWILEETIRLTKEHVAKY